MRLIPPGPRPRPTGVPLAALAAAAVAALALSAPGRSSAQATKKAATIDNRPLARYVPRDNLMVFAGTEGLDLQAEAWKKTAAYKMLNETSLGAMLEDMTAQFFERGLSASPTRKLNGEDIVAMAKHLMKAGFVVAFNAVEKSENGSVEFGTIVVRGGAGKSARGPFARLLGTWMGAAKTTKVSKGGRYVVIVPVSNPQSKETWAWWAEPNDDLVIVTGKGTEDVVMATAGGKKPSAVENVIRAELARADGGFTPVGQVFLDPSAAGKTSPASAMATQMIGFGVTRFDYRWGFQDDALMTVTRLKAPRPRRGVLAALDQPSFDKTKLPPLPEGIESFTVISVEADKSYDQLLSAATTPEARARLTAPADAFKAKTRIDLRKDLLARLGSKYAFYVMPGGPAPAAAGAAAVAPALAGNPLGGLLGGGQIPRFTLVAEVTDNAAFVKTLDNLMLALNREIRDRANAAADAAAAAKPETPAAPGSTTKSDAPKPRREPAAAPEFKPIPSSNPAERSYVLNIPAALARQFPAGFRPTIRLSNKQLIVSTTPESARQALEVKGGQWTPPADLAPAFDQLPKDLILLGARDPRPTLPENLASLPAAIQRAVNTMISQRQAAENGGLPPGVTLPPGVSLPPGMNGAPGATGAPGADPRMLVFKIPIDRLPKPEELREKLFPGSFAVSADDQEIRYVTRSAFPEVASPSGFVTGMAVLAPALQAARNAAQAAAARNAGAAAPPGAAAPGAAPPGATTKGAGATKPVSPSTKGSRFVPKD